MISEWFEVPDAHSVTKVLNTFRKNSLITGISIFKRKLRLWTDSGPEGWGEFVSISSTFLSHYSMRYSSSMSTWAMLTSLLHSSAVPGDGQGHAVGRLVQDQHGTCRPTRDPHLVTVPRVLLIHVLPD